MRFMTDYFPSLKHLAKACRQTPFKAPIKPRVTALEILNINEGLRDGNIDILKKFAEDLSVMGDKPIVWAQ